MFHLYYSPNILDKSSVFVIISNEWRKVNTVNNNQLKQNEKNQQIKVEEQMEKKEEKEPKDKQTKTKKRIKSVLKTILIITALVFSWRFYSLVRFEGRFTPWYVWGISNPYKYWQEHIGLKLIEHGKKYDLKPTIDENDPTTYNVYQNKEHHFRFKYPKGFDRVVDTGFHSDKKGLLLKLYDGSKDCSVDIVYKKGMTKYAWLTKTRSHIKRIVNHNKKLIFFYSRNGQVVYINSTVIPEKKCVSEFTGATYINKENNELIVVTVYGDKCLQDIAANVLATFEFTN